MPPWPASGKMLTCALGSRRASSNELIVRAMMSMTWCLPAKPSTTLGVPIVEHCRQVMKEDNRHVAFLADFSVHEGCAVRINRFGWRIFKSHSYIPFD